MDGKHEDPPTTPSPWCKHW